ncbi:MAG: peptidoglycan DD-metalloendopeptidase family protein [Burkholderiales bacterium]
MKLRRVATLALAGALAAGCASTYKAPVIDRAVTRPSATTPASPAAGAPEARSETYAVKRGDTLYSIALDNGLDYKDLADWNGITNPAMIQVGQALRLRAPDSGVQVQAVTASGAVEARPLGPEAPRVAGDSLKTGPKAIKLPYSEKNLALLMRQQAQPGPKPEPKPEPQPATPSQPEAPGADGDRIDWSWPSSGKVVAAFSESSNKGLDIGGKIGDPVYASASGRVVYSGTGLRGYGKLIIIKHNQTYLSAYAHNSNLLVKEGQNVTKGQKIAEVGNTDSDGAKLHFEIRRLGKPVDPLKFLPEHPS